MTWWRRRSQCEVDWREGHRLGDPDPYADHPEAPCQQVTPEPGLRLFCTVPSDQSQHRLHIATISTGIAALWDNDGHVEILDVDQIIHPRKNGAGA